MKENSIHSIAIKALWNKASEVMRFYVKYFEKPPCWQCPLKDLLHFNLPTMKPLVTSVTHSLIPHAPVRSFFSFPDALASCGFWWCHLRRHSFSLSQYVGSSEDWLPSSSLAWGHLFSFPGVCELPVGITYLLRKVRQYGKYLFATWQRVIGSPLATLASCIASSFCKTSEKDVFWVTSWFSNKLKWFLAVFVFALIQIMKHY